MAQTDAIGLPEGTTIKVVDGQFHIMTHPDEIKAKLKLMNANISAGPENIVRVDATLFIVRDNNDDA
jgi:hypothetical protein